MGTFRGQASDIGIQAREIIRLKETLKRILVKHTGRSFKQIQTDTDRDFYMCSEEAKQYGLVDFVIRNRDDLFQLEQRAA